MHTITILSCSTVHTGLYFMHLYPMLDPLYTNYDLISLPNTAAKLRESEGERGELSLGSKMPFRLHSMHTKEIIRSIETENVGHFLFNNHYYYFYRLNSLKMEISDLFLDKFGAPTLSQNWI